MQSSLTLVVLVEEAEVNEMKPKKLSARNQKGVAAVEFAIIAPLFFMLVFGIIEFSLALFDKAIITNASREGARAGIVYNFPNPITDAQITTAVNNYINNHLISLGGGGTGPKAVNITRTGTNPGDQLTVTVTYTYQFLILPNFVANLVNPNITASTVMRME